ncbi:MAG: bifunctional ADP-dependent NAD(P)H-hydrate dehydratase/NAD(P)H-hydrate epimerase [Spirochaetia bacterium]|nr:bifunctional ADP-dependent NAD(P)H-hydrate dehydratase/NAD(P)H-hydrate epimerase [Spirochaetia bacterium]
MNGNRPQLTYAECADLDKRTIAAGFSQIQLMGQAATASANRILATRTFSQIFILCGAGNNGGDGYAIAWMLIGHGLTSRIQIFATEPPRTEAAMFYANLVGDFLLARPMTDFCLDPGATPTQDDLILDAILGAGQKGSLRGPAAEAITKLSAIRSKPHRPCLIAIDCPSGLSEESDSVFTSISPGLPLPDDVHCFGPGNLALSLNASLQAGSEIHSLPVGFLPEEGPVLEWVEEPLKRKQPLDHKYTAGSAWMVAGERGMEGAAMLCSGAFFAAGGGICELRTFAEESRLAILAGNPTLMTGVLPDPFTTRAGVLLIGPGLRIDSEKRSILLDLLQMVPESMSVILDASACALVLDQRYPAFLLKQTLITPHSGEWERLGGPSPRFARSFKDAVSFGRSLGCLALVKSAVSVLLGQDRSFVYPKPEPSLAVAGSGDCLAGIIAALQSRPGASLEHSALAGLDLLHAAVKEQIHPASHEFPALIRLALARAESI